MQGATHEEDEERSNSGSRYNAARSRPMKIGWAAGARPQLRLVQRGDEERVVLTFDGVHLTCAVRAGHAQPRLAGQVPQGRVESVAAGGLLDDSGRAVQPG